MRMNQNLNIIELHSVVLVTPDKSEVKRKYNGYMPKYQLIYKLSGDVITFFNGKTIHILPGMVYIIPKCENAEYHIERTIVGDCIDIFFDTDDSFLDELYCLDFSSNLKIHDLFQKVYHTWITKAEGYYYKSLSIVYEILYEMIIKGQKYTKSNTYSKIEDGIRYIQNHLYDKDINYYQPSIICNVSYTYFKSKFIEKFGVPPIQYVTTQRLERARELLLTNQYSVSETATQCGFDNVYYFSKKFKERYQYAPTIFKKRLQ